MHKPQTLRVPRPRNPVIQSLIRRLASLGSGRHESTRRKARRHAEIDLDQRVREVGEW